MSQVNLENRKCKMAQTASESNKQMIKKLVNICNDDENRHRHKKSRMDLSENTSTMMAEIGLKHSNEILRIAMEYAYRRCSPSLRKKHKETKKKKDAIRIKIDSADILNAISYLNLPLSPHLTLKYLGNHEKQELNPVFLE